jgi:hypothetical protein
MGFLLSLLDSYIFGSLELAEEVIRTNPKTKQEFKEMIKEYSYKEDNKW